MPELPEVETIVTDLRPYVEGKNFKNIELLWHNTLLYPSAEEFNKSIDGRHIDALTRRGKYILFNLDDRDKNRLLVMHLRMTGSFLWKTDDEYPKHTRTIINFTDGSTLCFIDPRKFGKIMLGANCPEVDKLGVEPFDNNFTCDYLEQVFSKKTTPVKTVILDQEVIAGIGNMYADEALYDSRINPGRAAGSLTEDEIESLRKSIIKVLDAGIKAGGASVSDYFRPNGTKGHAHEAYKVAHNKDGVCSECGNKIARMVVGQRGTYYCAFCQK